jgi:hypothetical protein
MIPGEKNNIWAPARASHGRRVGAARQEKKDDKNIKKSLGFHDTPVLFFLGSYKPRLAAGANTHVGVPEEDMLRVS